MGVDGRAGRFSRRQLFFNAARSNSPSAPNVMVCLPRVSPVRRRSVSRRILCTPSALDADSCSCGQTDLLREGLDVDCVAPQTESHPGHHDYVSQGATGTRFLRTWDHQGHHDQAHWCGVWFAGCTALHLVGANGNINVARSRLPFESDATWESHPYGVALSCQHRETGNRC